jgi:signal transduction histidine kinase
LDEAISSLRSQERPVEIYTDFHQKDYFVMGGDLLLDAFENILLNGVIHNESSKVKLWINLSDLKRDGENYVKIEFKDNGIGIPDESKKVIFTKSYKREKATVGMGIGLSLVNEIISEYEGNIWVEDRVKGDYTQGTNLVLLLKKA